MKKLEGNQAELRDYKARLVVRSGFYLGMQLAFRGSDKPAGTK